MNNRKHGKLIGKLIRVAIAIILIGTLIALVTIWLLGLQYIATSDFSGMSENISIEKVGLTRIAGSLAIGACVVLICKVFYAQCSNSKNRMLLSLIASMIATGTICAWWIHFSADSLPFGDGRALWDLAEAIWTGSIDGYDLEYYMIYPHQKGFIWFLVICFRMIGRSTTLFRILNACASMVIVLLGGLIAYRISGKEIAGTMAGVMTTLFLPLSFYSEFIYGTLPSLAMVYALIYSVIRLIQTKKRRWLIMEGLASFMMYMLYSSTLIAVIAVMVTLLLGVIWCGYLRKIDYAKILLIGICIPVIAVMLVGVFSSNWFEKNTGIGKEQKGLPKVAWVSMGTSIENGSCGIGSFNYEYSLIDEYKQSGYDSDATSVIAYQNVQNNVNRLIADKTIIYFVKQKTISQWMNPFFGSASNSLYQVAVDYQPVIDSGVLWKLEKYLHSYELLVLSIVILGCVVLIKKQVVSFGQDLGYKEMQQILPTLLLILYFWGGWLFQLVWEQKSRYCFPFFSILIPIGAVVLLEISEKATKKDRKRDGKEESD